MSTDAHPCPVTAEQIESYEGRQAVLEAIQARLDADFEDGLESFRRHEACGLVALDRDLYALAWRRGRAASDPARRQHWVGVLSRAVVEQELFLAEQALKFLGDFSPGDYDPKSRAVLIALPLDEDHAEALIRVLGTARIVERVEELETIAGSGTVEPGTERWAALLALARMDHGDALQRVIARVRAEANIVTQSTLLFDDLAYTRQPAAFDELRRYLHSTERLPQLKDTVPGSPQGLSAARQFALHVEGCPVQGEDVSEGDLDSIRAWADAQSRWVLR